MSTAIKKSAERKFASKYGYFTADGWEYVITRPDTPRPWVNVLCNGDYGCTISQTGSGFSWRGNSNLSRITRWEQDLIRDEWGKYIYVRDAGDGTLWSLTWKPCCPSFEKYEARYGIGYATLKSSYHGIQGELTMFVDQDHPVEVWQVTLTNDTNRTRRLSLFTYFEWCLGNAAETHREFHKTFIETTIDRDHRAIYGSKRPALVPGFISTGLSETPLEAFHAASIAPTAYEGDKEAFFGRYGDIRTPRGAREGKLTNTAGKWGDAIASLHVDVTLKARDTQTVIFLVGAAQSRQEAATLIHQYANPERATQALAQVKRFWRELLEHTWVHTPDEGLNFLTNIWLRYQAICARIWARCAYYQSSGAFGFRDQLQDSHVFLPLRAELTKKQILLHAGAQFPDGTVYHWWHPGTSIGSITHMTDDLLWLAFLTLSYLDETADATILDEEVNFLPDPKDKQVETGTLYDHCRRSIDRVLSRWSPRGLPLIGEGDWNDGMSHVGVHWKGESVWLGHFVYNVLTRFAPVCTTRGEQHVASDYLQRAAALKEAINEHAWDGEWYIRATRDDGRPLGSKDCKEGKIFLNAQSWAIMAGTATAERAQQAFESCKKYLFREYGPLLFTPAYSEIDPTIGYLSRYGPGIRENGGLYAHAATWGVQATCMMRDGDLAYDLYNRFSPIQRGLDPEKYCCEPYVMPGNVEGPESPFFGRGGWTWYTGSAAWLGRVTLDWMLGVRAERDGLRIDPVIPKQWQQFTVKRLFRSATYNIVVDNPQGVSSGVATITVDGAPIDGTLIPPFADQKTHQVDVTLG